MQSTPPRPIHIFSRMVSFIQVFQTKSCYAHSISLTRAICPIHVFLLSTNYVAPNYSIHLLLSLSLKPKYSCQNLVLRHPSSVPVLRFSLLEFNVQLRFLGLAIQCLWNRKRSRQWQLSDMAQ